MYIVLQSAKNMKRNLFIQFGRVQFPTTYTCDLIYSNFSEMNKTTPKLNYMNHILLIPFGKI